MPALWKSKMAIRITGDCHGKIDQYVDDILNSNCSGSLQVGDMGFDYKKLNILDSSVHKFYGGNHENYDLYENCPYSLGDYGFYELLDFSFFLLGGLFLLTTNIGSVLMKFTIQNLGGQKKSLISLK